jgi:hypothetical protein
MRLQRRARRDGRRDGRVARDSKKRKERGGSRGLSGRDALAWELASASERAARAEVSVEFLRAQLMVALEALEVAADEVAAALKIATPPSGSHGDDRRRK